MLFRWQFVPYFLARYSVLAVVIVNAVDSSMESPTRSMCSIAIFRNVSFHLGLLSLVFGTWNLLTRALIIWGHHPLLMKILSVVGLIHLALALIFSSIERGACNPKPPSGSSITVFGTATAAIEFAILLLSLIGIKRASRHGESHLTRVLRTQGIAYFLAAFLIQVVTVATYLSQFNGPALYWVGAAGAILSTMISCRVVTSTLSQSDLAPESRTHRIDCFELSEDQGRNPTDGRMTTCIDLETTKDQSVC
ncbi:hypothetical protein BJ322DRAFT_785295 [Thelephora terrestris]|uniref:Uncharacterized protein n=1 Tax=Thelephora terrestris TaxID=56493 RepID=A0A9P6HHP1_9AGAM|nr:hypothetical protein BJ322DRAFT_785295 [Thelephora terrestris]